MSVEQIYVGCFSSVNDVSLREKRNEAKDSHLLLSSASDRSSRYAPSEVGKSANGSVPR